VRVGDPITFVRSGMALNGTRIFTGKAVDDRSGCAVMIETMRRLAESDVAATVVAVASVQEELGLRGAGPAAFRVQPDVAIALDVTLAGDTPATEFRQLPIKLGGGPAIKYFDWAPSSTIGSAVPRRLTRRLEEAAARAEVPFQREVLLGGATDAGSIALAGAGTLTGCVSIPSRHIHSAVGVVHLGDMEQCVDLLLAFADMLPLE
jgi:endoglucanase